MEEETKLCPYCGDEILFSAKKCKHCGKWIEKKCTYCSEWIKADAKKCRFCGSWINERERSAYENEPTKVVQMSNGTENVEKTIEDTIDEKEEKKQAGCLMNIECLIILCIFSYLYDWPWWGIMIAIMIGYILLSIQFLRIIYCIGISIVWSFIGVALGPLIFDDSDWDTLYRIATSDYADYWWIGAFLGIASLVFHWPAMKSKFNF